jgi:lipoprotein-anchoring transpeptidase ErfK/SrfK
MDRSPNSPTGTSGTPRAAGPDLGPAARVTRPTRAAVRPGAGPAVPRRSRTVPSRTLYLVGPLVIDQRALLAAVAALLVLLSVVGWAGTGYSYAPYADPAPKLSGQVPTGDRELQQFTARVERRSRELTARLKAAAPRGVYIVIDQTQNRLYLKKDDNTLLEAKCSAGSGMVLRESVGKKREWVFDSPRGRFEVLSLLRNPVWAKPDWAFVEDGEPIPTNPADRLETGSLGEYALYFGNGYMIHGTLYERLLGRAVSHGCVRVGRDDLRKVWANAHLGMRIFIY